MLKSWVISLGVALVVFGCKCENRSATQPATSSATPTTPAKPNNAFSVMSYNLNQLGVVDRDQDGQVDNPKPDEEITAALQLITTAKPDVLLLQEVGDQGTFSNFTQKLKLAGLGYDNIHFETGPSEWNLALLSRLPITSSVSHTNDMYQMKSDRVPVTHGFVDVELGITPSYRLRVLGAHLKARDYHPLGQTEMRRNEARLLNKRIRQILEQEPHANLLVLGTFSDSLGSAAMKEVTGKTETHVTAISLADSGGDRWTAVDSSNDTYTREDYMLVSTGLQPEVLIDHSYIVDDIRTHEASDHRPIVAVFQMADQ